MNDGRNLHNFYIKKKKLKKNWQLQRTPSLQWVDLGRGRKVIFVSLYLLPPPLLGILIILLLACNEANHFLLCTALAVENHLSVSALPL